MAEQMQVAFQGEHGAYSEAAALEHFGANVRTVPCESFEAVFEKIENGEAARGLVPIENSLAGSIHRNYDLLMRHTLSIVGERFLRVRHCLIGLPGAPLAAIRTVASHPQALAQCEGFLRELNVRSRAAYDTAGSVKQLKESGDPTSAAIASRHAAQVYGLEVLAEGIEDDPANYTRFLAIAQEPVSPQGDAKTSIVFTLDNQAGAMFKALSVFALRDIDLTKLESRPLVGKLWEYLFYIDFGLAQSDPRAQHALENLGEFAPMLRVLGTYPRHRPLVEA
ncbi:MAG: prephenate dehydratase [Anaerolineales bacterium]|nr:prephenate dehydratase [Anaerolineales bacterium]